MDEECAQPVQDCHNPSNFRVSDKLEKSKDRNWKGRGDTPLHHAAHAGHVKVVDLLSVEKYADVVNKASDSDGATPLMRCCETGAEECAELLLERGADINAENVRNERPLHIAFQHSHLGLAEILLKAGAKKCAGRCMKCQLSLKQLLRRQKRTEEEKLRQEKQDVSPVVVETAAVVLEEEFGNIDLAQEIARLKQETQGGRIPEGNLRVVQENTSSSSSSSCKSPGSRKSREGSGRKSGKGKGRRKGVVEAATSDPASGPETKHEDTSYS